MSERHRVQDGTGVVWTVGANLIGCVVQNTTPTNGKAGYSVGCIWVNTAGTVGTILYVNTGTASSTTWTNVV